MLSDEPINHDLIFPVPPDLTDYRLPRSETDRITRERLALQAYTQALAWLVNAPPGARRTYHQGHLARDRDTSSEANTLAKLFRRASLAKLVRLVQARTSPNSCDYLAVRTTRVWIGELPELPIGEDYQ